MLVRIALYAGVIFVLLALFARYVERNGVFFPSKDIRWTPKDAGLAFEDVYLTTSDGVRLHGWFIPRPDATHTVLFLHGNAGTIGDRLDKLAILHKLGYSVFIIDYRGYGRSGGRPTEAGLYRDARAAFDWLIQKRSLRESAVFIYGESIGSAAAIDLAAAVGVRGLILEGAFSSAKDMARVHYPFVPGFLISLRLDSLSKIGRVPSPVLFLGSKSDEVVPYALTRRLFDAAREPKVFVELKGGHNTMFFDSAREYAAAIEAFMAGKYYLTE